MSEQASQVTTAPASSGGANSNGTQGSVNGRRTSIADAPNFDRTGLFDVVRSFPWTPSTKNNRNDIPEIILYEHRNNESAILRNIMFYANGLNGLANQAGNAGTGALLGALFAGLPGAITGGILGALTTSNDTTAKNLLEVYKEIFPDNPTGNTYYLPYFTKSYMELSSPPWEQLDDISTSIEQLAKSAADAAGAVGLDGVSQGIAAARSIGGFAKEVGMTALRWAYPIVGVYDRPRIFASHDERSVNIQFPLYNTLNADDWKMNRDLIYKFMVQSLYTKNSFITGYPPVFYRVLVPGQYFSFASCVTDFSVQNLGNVRKMYGFNVPDAFQVSLTLREMCMPSANQFRAMANGEAAQKINVSINGGLAPGARLGPGGELF